MVDGGEWCLIESDPGVFTQLIRKFGANGVQVEEIWSMEDSMFDNLRPVHGLIFLFKYLDDELPTGPIVIDKDRLERIYFARQVIQNACATQAVINLLLNCDHPDLDLGPELTKLKEFSLSFDPLMRGLTLSNSHTIRSAHNSMAHQYLYEFDRQYGSKEDAAFHFISYIPIEGRLYELDGLNVGPIDHGPIGIDTDWLDVVRPIITRRIQQYTVGEIRFNLMAVVSDRKMVYERQLNNLIASSRLLGIDTDEVNIEAARLRMMMDYEELKMDRYESEMIRRRHNYMPFLIRLLIILGEQKQLTPLLEPPRVCEIRRGPKRLKT